MRLFEYESKLVLHDRGVNTPVGQVVNTPEAAATIASRIGPVALKAQILVSGRGKAGGILFADSPDEARKAASRLLGTRIKGLMVERLLVESRLEILAEYFVSVSVDPKAKSYVAMASKFGGVEIEARASAEAGAVVRRWFQPVSGLGKRQSMEMAAEIGLMNRDGTEVASILDTISVTALEKDAELVEINPLVKTRRGQFVAADCRMTIDDNALFRQPLFQSRSSERIDDSPLEAQARRQNMTYVDLEGSIGIVGNGAGLVMATLDMVELFGGKPANFLDIGGGARPEIVKKSVELVMSKPEVRTVIVNILGGITRCDLVAEGVISALKEAAARKPVVVRMIGTNEEAGTTLLKNAGVSTYTSMEEAVRIALERS